MDFVTFEIAKKLKEKGFREKVNAYYDGIKFQINNIHPALDMNASCYLSSAPTISQVLKWLREKKHLFIEIFMYHNHYMWEIYNTDMYNNEDGSQKSEGHSGKKYVSYELAALAGIEYVLDNLI